MTKTSRRDALKRAGVGLAGVALTGGTFSKPAIAQERIKWRMVTSWPKNLPGPGVTAQRIADRISELSAGRLTVDLYAAGEIVPALETFAAVSNGTAQIAHTAPLFWSRSYPIAPLFTAGPFGLTPIEHITWIEQGGGQKLWDELYEPAGIKPFMAGNTGYQMGGWYKEKLNGLSDLKGLKIRMPGLGGAVMGRLGAVPVALPPSEIFTALKTGIIDATEFLGPFSDAAMGFHKAASYYYSPGFHEPNGTGEALISRVALDNLPDNLRAIVETVCRSENIYSLAEAEWNNALSLARLEREFGVEVLEYPNDILDAARQATSQVLEDLKNTDALSARIVDSYTGAAKTMARWSSVSVGAFLKAR